MQAPAREQDMDRSAPHHLQAYYLQFYRFKHYEKAVFIFLRLRTLCLNVLNHGTVTLDIAGMVMQGARSQGEGAWSFQHKDCSDGVTSETSSRGGSLVNAAVLEV